MMSYQVFIVEDEIKLLEHLSRIMNDAGLLSFACSSFRELEAILDLPNIQFDVVILDRLLQSRDSTELMGKLKSRFPKSQIIILSAINTSSEKANLLNRGADDYLSKPFDSDELVARVRALLRRSKNELQFSNILLDLNSRAMKIQGEKISLTNKEFALLRTLIQAPGKIFNKTFLHEQVWEMSTEVESHVVEATVNKLRKRLAEAGAQAQIKNTRHIGYWIEE